MDDWGRVVAVGNGCSDGGGSGGGSGGGVEMSVVVVVWGLLGLLEWEGLAVLVHKLIQHVLDVVLLLL